MSNGKTATFGIRVQVDSNANEGARDIEALKNSLLSSQDAVKKFSAAQRSLRGTSDEVKAAKDKLKGAVSAERDAISRATLALGKHGLTLTDVTRRTKDAAGETSGMFAKLGESLGLSASSMVLVAGAGAAVVATIVAIGAAAISSAISLGKFVLENANLLRAQGLEREAASGSAANAAAWGTQIEDAGRRIPKTVAELNDLAVSVSRTFTQTRISGKGMVDAFNAIGEAGAANGDAAGKALEELLSRGKQFGRFGLGFAELRGGNATGLQFADIAEALSKNLGIGLKQAQQQLLRYRVSLDDGAKAIRDAVEKRFGVVNAKKLIDLDFMGKRLKDTFTKMTKDIGLENILTSLDAMLRLLDSSTVEGKAFGQVLKGVGKFLSDAFEAAVPKVEALLDQLILNGQRVAIAFLKLEIQMRETFGNKFTDYIIQGTVLFDAMGFAVKNVADTITFLLHTMQALMKFIKSDWVNGGDNIAKGAAQGVRNSKGELVGAVGDMSAGAQALFATHNRMQSPSKVYSKYGEYISEGVAEGVEKKSPQAQDAVEGIVTPKAIDVRRADGGAASGNVGGGHTFNVAVNVTPGPGEQRDTIATLTGPSFRAQFTKMLEDCLTGAGVPIQQRAP